METQNTQPPKSPMMEENAPPLMPLIPVAQPVSDPWAVSQDDRTMGMLVHLLALLVGIVGVLIIWLVKKDGSRFVDFHGKDALNFQLTLFLVSVALLVVGFITVIGVFIAIPLVGLIGVGAFVLEIMACLAASRGEWHRYPFAIKFIS